MFRRTANAEEVDRLIARKRYAKAIELVRELAKAEPHNIRWRTQLADLLAVEGPAAEAVQILAKLANELAEAGFDAKAIAVLKKIQRIDPENRSVPEKIAALIRRQRRDHDLLSRLPREEVEPVLVRLADEGHGEPSELSRELAAVSRVPLFSDFSHEDLLVVIGGLTLKSFGAGQIIVTEGEPGESLFVLANGAVRVYVKNPWGRSEEVRLMHTGEIFGEISLLTRQPRSATIVCCSPCEVLELDRATLDRIAQKSPEVPRIIKELYRRRAGSPEELAARGEVPPPP